MKTLKTPEDRCWPFEPSTRMFVCPDATLNHAPQPNYVCAPPRQCRVAQAACPPSDFLLRYRIPRFTIHMMTGDPYLEGLCPLPGDETTVPIGFATLELARLGVHMAVEVFVERLARNVHVKDVKVGPEVREGASLLDVTIDFRRGELRGSRTMGAPDSMKWVRSSVTFFVLFGEMQINVVGEVESR